MSGKFDPLFAPLPLHNPPPRAPLTLRRVLALPLTAPLPLTRFPGRSAPFSAPLTLRSHALIIGQYKFVQSGRRVQYKRLICKITKKCIDIDGIDVTCRACDWLARYID